MFGPDYSIKMYTRPFWCAKSLLGPVSPVACFYNNYWRKTNFERVSISFLFALIAPFPFRSTFPCRPIVLHVPCWALYFNKYLFFWSSNCLNTCMMYVIIYWCTSRDEMAGRWKNMPVSNRKSLSSCLQQTTSNNSIYTRRKADQWVSREVSN